MKIFFAVVAFIFISCNQKVEEKTTDDTFTDSDIGGEPDSLPVISSKEVEVMIFRLDSIDKSKPGFGYDIVVDGILYIHQPMIPAVPGERTFQTREEAERVAELVAFKIRNNIMPPSVTVAELDSIGIP